MAMDNRDILAQALRDGKNNINLTFLPQKDYNVLMTEELLNQVMVVYRNGRFEILPVGVTGARVREYLGVWFSRIKCWTLLPIGGHEKNPVKSPAYGVRSERDVYEG